MSAKAKKYTCWGLQFCSGGASYGFLEILWRGYTHVSMLIVGGICFCIMIRIAKMESSLLAKSILGGLFITTAEFISGCIVNIWLGLSVWDYSNEPLAICGQVCIRYTLLWVMLCAIIIPICRIIIDMRLTSNQSIMDFVSRFVPRILRKNLQGIYLHNRYPAASLSGLIDKDIGG